MQHYKKYVISLLIGFIIMTVICLPLSAISSPQISAGTADCRPGDTITVPITVSNNAGVISLSLTVEYDTSVFTLVEVNDTGLLPGSMHTTKYVSPYLLTWNNDDVSGNYTVNGTLVNLVFAVSDQALDGNYPIRLRYPRDGMIKSDGTNDEFVLQYGVVSISSASEQEKFTVSGSITGYGAPDGAVTVRLFSTVSEEAASVTTTNGTYAFSIPSGIYRLEAVKADCTTHQSIIPVLGEDAVHDIRLYLEGDVNGDDLLNAADAAYLSRYIKNPDNYPLASTFCDFNEDGFTDHVDAEYLLWELINKAN